MSNKLSEMTLEELWKLFPISLTKHNPCWADWYIEEVDCLRGLLPYDIQYFHVGSTAVKDIMAKPIIDILAVVDSYEEMVKSASILKEHNYIIMSEFFGGTGVCPVCFGRIGMQNPDKQK